MSAMVVFDGQVSGANVWSRCVIAPHVTIRLHLRVGLRRSVQACSAINDLTPVAAYTPHATTTDDDSARAHAVG